MDNILKQQKRAIRVMLQLKNDASVRENFKTLKIPTVYGQYIFETMLIAKSANLKDNLKLPAHNYNTRNRNEIIQAHRLRFYEKKPIYNKGNKFLRFVPDYTG